MTNWTPCHEPKKTMPSVGVKLNREPKAVLDEWEDGINFAPIPQHKLVCMMSTQYQPNRSWNPASAPGPGPASGRIALDIALDIAIVNRKGFEVGHAFEPMIRFVHWEFTTYLYGLAQCSAPPPIPICPSRRRKWAIGHCRRRRLCQLEEDRWRRAKDEPVFKSTTPSAMNLEPIKTDSTTQIDTQANRRGSATQTNNLVLVIKTEHVTTLDEVIDESVAEIDELNSIKREINNLTEATHLSWLRNPSVVEFEEQLAHTQSVLDQLAKSDNLIHELSDGHVIIVA